MVVIRAIISMLIEKGCEQESMLQEAVREPRLVRRGTGNVAEDGLGAGVSIGRHSRVRPSKRLMRQHKLQIKVVPR